MAKGYIYIMTNPSFPNMVKIGYATDVEARREQLSNSALPYKFEVYATYETSGKLEDKKLHKLIDSLNPGLRISKDREFYKMSAEKAYALLETIAIISGTQDRLKPFRAQTVEKEVIATKVDRWGNAPLVDIDFVCPYCGKMVVEETIRVAEDRLEVLDGPWEMKQVCKSCGGKFKVLSY